MEVVNVRVKYIRPQFSDLYDWCGDSSNVYIGRRGPVFIKSIQKRYPLRDSIWASPFKIGRHGTREEVIEMYRTYILSKIENENLWDELRKLKGKRLGCWCKPERCHGDVLLELIASHCP